MKTKEGLGSVKRFGARYGRKTKLKFSKIEIEQRKLHKCPYCSKTTAKRMAVGIWQCNKCKARFTGKAYSISKPIIFQESSEPLIQEEEKEMTEIKEVEKEVEQEIAQSEE